jgi:hypothetical protein
VAGLGIETPEDNKSFRTRMIVKVIKTFYPAVIHDRQKGYQILAGSNIDWTIVRCPMIELTDSKRLLKVDLRDSPGIKVSAADLADFLVRQITDDQYIKKCPFVAS